MKLWYDKSLNMICYTDGSVLMKFSMSYYYVDHLYEGTVLIVQQCLTNEEGNIKICGSWVII